jgi:hypothetical protein
VRTTYESGRKQRVDGAGVPQDEQIRTATEVRIALDLEAEAKEPDGGPE